MALSQRRERLVARLRTAKTRAREHAVLVEGVRAVSEALDAGVAADFAVTSPRLHATKAGARLAERLEGRDVVRVEDSELEHLSDTDRPQGVLLVCGEPEAGLDRVVRGGRYLVLDHVQDPGNAGTLVRAAVAFGLAAVVCLDGTVDPWGPKTVRSSAGMIFRIPVVRADAQEAAARLAAEGIPLFVADVEGGDVGGHRGAPSFALVVGNEGAGVRPELLERADERLGVGMPGPAESLNVAMAGSILLHVLTRGNGRG
ncbi:MAG TPA: RNA methyltransferase [Longimicrobiales bacterium]|nr:RNA methyltransferase [Longimicrobiales bacterium]